MLDFCRSAGVPIDFVSTHHYPTDDPLWRNSNLTIEEFFRQFAHEMGKYERGVLRKMTAAREQAGDLPLYYTEWNISAALPDPLHDEPYAAAMVLKTIADNDGLVDGYSFWTFSDLFEERGQFAAPFHGGFGLQNIYGIPKPTYRIFELLHRLGDRRLPVGGGAGSTAEVLAVRDGSRLTVLAYNHNVPAEPIGTEEVVLALQGVALNGPVGITRLDDAHANPKQRWIELGSPEYPTRDELAELERASVPVVNDLMPQRTVDGSRLVFSLPPYGVACLTIELA